MEITRLIRFASFFTIVCTPLAGTVARAADAPSTAQALALTPIQSLVEYAIPTKEEAAQCTNRAEKVDNVTAWVVRNARNEILRRFADTNGDNVVDQWCYYLDGLEVYRDIDANFNGKADQYRWFNSAGTRWGIDKNEDRKIDSWKVMSPHEVGEQIVFALKNKDESRFGLLLVNATELNEAGFAKARVDQISTNIQSAPAGFSKLAGEQKIVTPKSRFVDFGSARPATIPAGAGGSTQDVTVIDNASALVETDGKHEQVYLGTLVAIGDSWKLLGAPTIGSDEGASAGGFLTQTPDPSNATSGGTAPSDEMQKLMAELQQLDEQSSTLPDDKQTANIEARAEKLQRLATLAPADERDQWYRQLADMLSVAAQSGNFPNGLARLDQLQQTLAQAGAGEDAVSHAAFQRMWAEYVTSQRAPNAEPSKVQEKWLADLQVFVAKYPKSSDSAEALLQLGMYQEFVGKTEEASKWYQQLVRDFPSAEPAKKANGALRRLNIVGKPMQLSGTDLVTGRPVDLRSYKQKVVLIHYWATWYEHSKEDMVLLKDFYAKKGGRDFDIVGVCLDHDAAAAKEFLTQNRFAWKQLHEQGGLDGRLANQMGVLTTPLMILVDQNGNVANNNIQVAELEAELARLTQGSNTANSSRSQALPR